VYDYEFLRASGDFEIIDGLGSEVELLTELQDVCVIRYYYRIVARSSQLIEVTAKT